MELKVKVKDVLKSKRMTQTELATKTGLRPSTISDMCRQSRTTINLEHITKVAQALEVASISELIDFE